MKVFVYYNLHKKMFSVKALEGEFKGKVISHSSTVVLQDVTFKVSEAGRQRVIASGHKNVHAGLIGYWLEEDSPNDLVCDQIVTYNPHKYTSFVDSRFQPVKSAQYAILIHKQVYACNVK